jgi:hypothetical protein
MGWLQVAHEATAPPDGSDVGQILRWYRKHEKLTQHDAASMLNTTQSRLSKLEKGSQALRDVWVPDGPVDLTDIALSWRTESPAPQIEGKAPESAGARPLMANGERYSRYSRALRDLARPRLLNIQWAGTRGELGFSYTSYFDVLDIGEALGHEFTEAWHNAGRKRPSLADLPFRRSIADPFDLLARPMLPSINTLTIRRDPIEGHRMYLHRRDAKAVAAAGGMYHVIPAGVFQPAALAPAHRANDFSLWRNVQREFSEEFLGNSEHDGNSVDPISYETEEPFTSWSP